MEPFRSPKRSSVSFGGTSARTVNHINTLDYNDTLQYDNDRQDSNDNNNNNNDSYDNTANNGTNSSLFYSNRSPMYSPLDFSNSTMFGPNYTQTQQSRGYNIIPSSNNNWGTGANNNNSASSTNVMNTNMNRGDTVCEWESHAPLYAMDWSMNDMIALGTYKEDSRNKLQIIGSQDQLTWDKLAESSVTYPVSKIQWLPNSLRPRQLATGSDSLRIWSLNESNGELQEQINLSLFKYYKQHNKNNDSTSMNSNKILGELPPITSFDWNSIETNSLISCSIDTTCIVWDLNSSNYVKTQLIAHDSEVYDVRFLTKSTQIFASCGGDGSVRVFDLRSLAHSTIIYEPPVHSTGPNLNNLSLQNHALLRLEPSPSDPNILATFVCDSNSIIILDMRNPESPVLILDGHDASINQIKWHPTKRNILLSCGDDCQILCWDINKYLENGVLPTTSSEIEPARDSQDIEMLKDEKIVGTPNSFFTNGTEEVNNIVWKPDNGNWLGAVGGKKFRNIRVY